MSADKSKPYTIKVSHHNLTRCESCARHVKLSEEQMDIAVLRLLKCELCGDPLVLGSNAYSASSAGKRSARFAASLMAVGLTMSGCPDEQSVSNPMAGAEPAGIQAGVQPAGAEPAGVESAGVQAGVDIAITPYGVFPTDMGTSPEQDMMIEPAPDMDLFAPEYGVFPDPDQGVEAGVEAGATATAGESAGAEAGTATGGGTTEGGEG
jgi:hypothetical protein